MHLQHDEQDQNEERQGVFYLSSRCDETTDKLIELLKKRKHRGIASDRERRTFDELLNERANHLRQEEQERAMRSMRSITNDFLMADANNRKLKEALQPVMTMLHERAVQPVQGTPSRAEEPSRPSLCQRTSKL